MKPDWTPREFISNGIKVFCSPACGGKHRFCSLEAYNKAKAKALQMARTLGEDWIPTVDENLGWHSRAQHNSLNIIVYCDGPKAFSCELAAFGLHHYGRGSSPKRALYSAIDSFHSHLDCVLELESFLKGAKLST